MILLNQSQAFYRRSDYGIVLSVRYLTWPRTKALEAVPLLHPILSMCRQTAENLHRRKMKITLLLVLLRCCIMPVHTQTA